MPHSELTFVAQYASSASGTPGRHFVVGLPKVSGVVPEFAVWMSSDGKNVSVIDRSLDASARKYGTKDVKTLLEEAVRRHSRATRILAHERFVASVARRNAPSLHEAILSIDYKSRPLKANFSILDTNKYSTFEERKAHEISLVEDALAFALKAGFVAPVARVNLEAPHDAFVAAKLFESQFGGELVLDHERAKIFVRLAAKADKWKTLFTSDIGRLAIDAARLIEAEFLEANPGFKTSVAVIRKEGKGVFEAAAVRNAAAA